MKMKVTIRHFPAGSARPLFVDIIVDAESGDDAYRAAGAIARERGLLRFNGVHVDSLSAEEVAVMEPAKVAQAPKPTKVAKPAASQKSAASRKSTKVRAANPILAALEAESRTSAAATLERVGAAGDAGDASQT